MRSGICVKCRSNRIYVLPSSISTGYGRPDLHLANTGYSNTQDSHFLACRDCGFTERYVNAERLHLLEKFGRSLAEAQAMVARDQTG